MLGRAAGIVIAVVKCNVWVQRELDDRCMRFGCYTKFARISCSVVQRIMQDHLASSVYKHRLRCSNSDHPRDPCHKSTNPIQFNDKTKFQQDARGDARTTVEQL